MRNVKLTLEYVGTNYYGWQILPDRPTIQGELKGALEKILRHEVKIVGAGRTDAGVHALGQVANFKTDRDVEVWKIQRALNSLLPPDIKVVKAEEAPLNFDSRRNAKGKIYRYRIFTREVPSPFEYKRSWFLPLKLKVSEMEKASEFLIGVHDFSAFCKKEKKKEVNPVREINEIRFEEKENLIEIVFYGNSFLRYMVRIMVATLVEVGKGKLSPSDVKSLLEKKERVPLLAPPDGLYLEKVFY